MRLRLLVPILAILIGVLVVAGSFYNAGHSEKLNPQRQSEKAGSSDKQAKPKGGEQAKADEELSQDQAKQADQTQGDSQKGQANEDVGESPGPAEVAQRAQDDSEKGKTSKAQGPATNSQSSTAEQSKPRQNQAKKRASAKSQKPSQLSKPQRSLKNLHLQPGHYQTWLSIGSNKKDQPYRMKVVFNGYGAGIQQLTMAKQRATAAGEKPYALINLSLDRVTHATPYGARTVWVNGQAVALSNDKWQTQNVQTTKAGQSITFGAVIVNDQAQPVLEIVRTYSLAKDSYELSLKQKLINRCDGALNVALKQNAQGDLLQSQARYVGDRRRFVTGYFKPDYDQRLRIYTSGGYRNRRNLVDQDKPTIWPNPNLSTENHYKLAWLGAVNRYFALVTHAPVPASAQGPPQTADIPALESEYQNVGVHIAPKSQNLQAPSDKYVVLTLQTDGLTLKANQTLDRSLGIYAGPRKSEVFDQQPFEALYLGRLVRYQLGCTWFTFQPLAHGMLWFLKLIEGQIISIGGLGIGVHDWGVAIMILVAFVRLLLHPITKKAQVNMMKMGKQMQALKPEMDKIKAKYKDNQQKLNSEMMKLYREKGMNPANMLGCAPMLLQTPIWIALYAMLFYAIELRHEPAFYGFFQWISAGHWRFLADLSRSDHFITFFSEPHPIQLIFIRFDYSAFNILPLLMGVVFYINQKFTQPPAANEQAAQQQKMMKFMVLLFPLFLYSAPSGLTLYICTSTLAGIFDSYLVRKHVREQEEAGTLFTKKQRKPGGFMDRMNKVMQQKQEEIAAKQQQTQKAGGGGAGGDGGNRQQRRKKSR